jgi:hypothetical protein
MGSLLEEIYEKIRLVVSFQILWCGVVEIQLQLRVRLTDIFFYPDKGGV